MIGRGAILNPETVDTRLLCLQRVQNGRGPGRSRGRGGWSGSSGSSSVEDRAIPDYAISASQANERSSASSGGPSGSQIG